MELRLSDVVGGLSAALDITEGEAPGHSRRTCVLAMRLAEAVGLEPAARSSLFYAALLKDAGCSTNAAAVAELFGADDQTVKRDRKRTNHRRARESAAHTLRSVAPGRSPLTRFQHVRALVASGSDGARALVAMRCERGADIAREVGVDATGARAIRELDEHWDGGGYPDGLAGEGISLPGRILALAGTAEIYWSASGRTAAQEVVAERCGTWFDPALCDVLRALPASDPVWPALLDGSVRGVEPVERIVVADEATLDRVASGFARVVDAKSPYTARHSAGVAELTDMIAAALGHDEPSRRRLRRAALLHDLGKLGVSNRILDKPGRLDEEEWRRMRRHPALTYALLARVPVFRDVAWTAAAHHERLDGSGYHLGVDAERLREDARIIAVADVAEALGADRPYRAALSPEEVLAIVRRDAGTRLCADAFAALEGCLSRGAPAQETAPAALAR